MEDLFGNLYVLIPIAVVIALRIIGSRKKSADNRAEKPAPPIYKPPVYIYEEHDDEEPIRRVETIVIPEPAGEAYSAAEGAFQPVEHPVSSSRPAFPQSLDYLPPLQRAFALTEILGPPKALQQQTQ